MNSQAICRWGCAAIIVLAMLYHPVPARPQGFGLTGTTVTLDRNLLPLVHVIGSKIAVQVAATDASDADLAATIKNSLEAELLRDDKTLTVDESKPDTLITCKLTGVSLPQPATVSRTVMNAKGKLESREAQFVEVRASLALACEAKDTDSGWDMDSADIPENYAREFGSSGQAIGGFTNSLGGLLDKKKAADQGGGSSSPPNTSELRGILADRAAKDEASRFVGTHEILEVRLARGRDLDKANKLAEAGLWNRMIETLETMSPLPNPKEDSYRLYNLGVAYEASAYEAKDPADAVKFMDRAAANYAKAVDENQGEASFQEPQHRVETAAERYKYLAEQQAHQLSQVASEGPTQAAAGGGSAAQTGKAASSGLTDDDIINMTKAGINEETILDTLRQTGSTSFDVSPQGLVRLKVGGVSARLTQAMIERQGQQAPASGILGQLPEFPWPPPAASATVELPAAFLSRAGGQMKTLGDLREELDDALEQCGYMDRSFYSVPGGFAIATRLEQIKPDGTPMDVPARWAAQLQPLQGKWNLADYVKALFTARVGFYRVIVFVVTSQPFTQGPQPLTSARAAALVGQGADRLPTSMAKKAISDSYGCTALIYEFRQPEMGLAARLDQPSELPGQTHLEKARLWEKLVK